jgi:predicted amidohydrolase YtcJ
MRGDCVLIGTIYTLDGSRREVGGIAIRGGRIVYVGEAREARRQGGPGAEVVNLGDQVALPGFVESHSHLILLGRYLEEVDCPNCSSLEEIIEALGTGRARLQPANGWWATGMTTRCSRSRGIPPGVNSTGRARNIPSCFGTSPCTAWP